MDSIPHESTLHASMLTTGNRIDVCPVEIGGVAMVQISITSPGDGSPSIVIRSVSDAEHFAVQILDACLSTKTDDDPIATMVRHNLASLPGSTSFEEDTSPC